MPYRNSYMSAWSIYCTVTLAFDTPVFVKSDSTHIDPVQHLTSDLESFHGNGKFHTKYTK